MVIGLELESNASWRSWHLRSREGRHAVKVWIPRDFFGNNNIIVRSRRRLLGLVVALDFDSDHFRHFLGEATKEEFVVPRAGIKAPSYSPVSPQIELPVKRTDFRLLEKHGNVHFHELGTPVIDSKGSAVREPRCGAGTRRCDALLRVVVVVGSHVEQCV